MSAHDPRFDDLAPAYLLGALEPHEAEAFTAHLDGCDACREQLVHLKPATDALPHGVPQVEAPPALKGRIMAVVQAEAELLRAAGDAADRPAPAPAPARRSWLPGWLGRPAFALAAVLVVLVAGAVAGVAVSGSGSGTRSVVAQTAPKGSAVRLLVRHADGHSTLTATGLPGAGADRVYQVWLRKGDGDPRPTNALFTPDNGGSASVDVPGDVDGQDVLVTSEPSGGSRTPTTKPIIAVSTA